MIICLCLGIYRLIPDRFIFAWHRNGFGTLWEFQPISNNRTKYGLVIFELWHKNLVHSLKSEMYVPVSKSEYYPKIIFADEFQIALSIRQECSKSGMNTNDFGTLTFLQA